MTEPTQRPWSQRTLMVVAANGTTVTHCGGQNKHSGDECEANAALIVRLENNEPELGKHAAKIAEILEAIDNRCMAADGPVTKTLKEAQPGELVDLYVAADRIRALVPVKDEPCTHEGWSFEKHGRCCFKCGAFLVDPGD